MWSSSGPAFRRSSAAVSVAAIGAGRTSAGPVFLSRCRWQARSRPSMLTPTKQAETGMRGEDIIVTRAIFATSKRALSITGVAAALFALALMPGAAQAKWPEKPVRIVLPFGPGGVADVTARIMADRLTKKLGQQMVIENMPGPGGINAARAVIGAPADGYTMGLVTNGTAISVAAFNHLPFDPTQFQMVSTIGL